MNKIYLFVTKFKDESILTIGFVLLAILFNRYKIIGDANYYNSFSQLLLSGLNNFSLGNQLVFQGQGLQQYGASLFYLPFQFLSEIIFKINLFSVERSTLNAVFVGLGLIQYHKRQVVLAFAISLIANLVSFSGIYFYARAIGVNIPLVYFYLMLPIVYMILSVPISIGGLGIQDALYVYFLGQAGVPAANALSLSLIIHFVRYTMYTLGGLLFAF